MLIVWAPITAPLRILVWIDTCSLLISATVMYAVAPDTPERTLKFIGKRWFGFGAELLPFLNRREAKAVRLVCTDFEVAVDRRAWPVRATHTSSISLVLVLLVQYYY